MKIMCALATNEVDVVITLIIMHQKDEASIVNIKNKTRNKSEQKKNEENNFDKVKLHKFSKWE